LTRGHNADIEVWKVLTANDTGETGSHQAGIHIPKHIVRLSFFPELDEESFNPECLIETLVEPVGRRLAVRYVHYNGKLTGANGRDEYRITRTPRILDMVSARTGDLLRFRWLESGEMGISLHSGSGADYASVAGGAVSSASGSNGWSVIQVVLPSRH
jgi:hypothetical protein